MEEVVRPLPERRSAEFVRTGAMAGPPPPEEDVDVVALDRVRRAGWPWMNWFMLGCDG